MVTLKIFCKAAVLSNDPSAKAKYNRKQAKGLNLNLDLNLNLNLFQPLALFVESAGVIVVSWRGERTPPTSSHHQKHPKAPKSTTATATTATAKPANAVKIWPEIALPVWKMMKLPMWPRSTFTVPAICWPRTSTVSLLSSPPPPSSPPKFLVAVVVNYFLAGERAKTNAHNSKTRNPSFPPPPSPHLPRQCFPCCLEATSDPFVKVFFNDELVGRTETKKSNLNPVWNHELTVPIYELPASDDDDGPAFKFEVLNVSQHLCMPVPVSVCLCGRCQDGVS